LAVPTSACLTDCSVVVAWQKFFLTGVRVPYLFRTYRHIKGLGSSAIERNPDHHDNYPIWQVARATSAAPFYFKSVKMGRGDELFEFVDGALARTTPVKKPFQK
jgi:patatin-like phospholipase/acyl hydrolase